jgi:dienelactone hydrolase
MDTASPWQERFTRPRIVVTRVAPADRTAGLVTIVDGQGPKLHAWDVPTGVTTPVATPSANLFAFCLLGHDGRYAYVLADDHGNELGHLTAVAVRGGAEPVDLTPGLAPYTLRGADLSATGAGLVIDAVSDDGYRVYYLADPVAAGQQPRLLGHYRDEAWFCRLSADAAVATIDTTERNPGVRRFAVRALRTADGEPVGVFSDGPGSSVEAKLFSRRPGDPTVAVTTDRSGVRRPVLWRIDHDTRRRLDVGDLAGDVLPIDWSDDGRFLLLCHFWRGSQQLLRYDLEHDRMELLELPAGSHHDDLDGSCHFGPDGTVLAATETLATPLTVYRHRPGGPTEVALASAPAPPGTPARSVDLPSSDGTLVQGWLATPAGPGPHPTILHVHGGPHGAEQGAYHPYAQMWLDHGYAYLGLNYRGSTSFGTDYREQIWGDIGHWEVEDMAAARQWLVESGVAGPDRVLVTGASYGGFLTLYALSVRPELWAGGIAEVATADWRLQHEDANPAIQRAIAAWHAGTPEQVPERYRASSPLTHLAKLTAPVLIRQGRHDSRCPARQMEVYEQAARRLGKPVTVLWDEGGHAQLDDPLAYLQRVLDFAAGLRGATGHGGEPR